MADNESENTVPERERRRFAVSANRGKASHRIRYVETGGASVDNEECTFCQAVPGLADEPEDGEKSEETGEDQDNEQAGSDASANAGSDRSRSKPSADTATQTDDGDSAQ
jgi:hypothetical protein